MEGCSKLPFWMRLEPPIAAYTVTPATGWLLVVITVPLICRLFVKPGNGAITCKMSDPPYSKSQL